MRKVEKTEGIIEARYHDDEKKWKDSAGNTSYSEQDARLAIESEITSRESYGLNTLRPSDGVAMIIAVFGLVLLGGGAIMGLSRQPIVAMACAVSFVLGCYLFFKFFMGTMPSFRTKVYLGLVALFLMANFLLGKYFNFKLI